MQYYSAPAFVQTVVISYIIFSQKCTETVRPAGGTYALYPLSTMTEPHSRQGRGWIEEGKGEGREIKGNIRHFQFYS